MRPPAIAASTTAGDATRELVAVVLAEREHVKAELVGGARMGERLVEPVERRDRPTRLRVGRQIAERDDPELDRSQRTSIASLPCVC